MDLDILVALSPRSAADPAVCRAALEKAGQGHQLHFLSAADAGSAAWVLFWQSDALPRPGLFDALEKAAARWPDAGALECRRLPLEQSKLYDPSTLQTDFFSGPAVCIRRQALEAAGGWQAGWPDAAARLDLSFRLRAAGYSLYYCPDAAVDCPAPPDDLENYRDQLIGRLLLAFQYGTIADAARAKFAFIKALRRPRPFAHVRPTLLKGAAGRYCAMWAAFLFRFSRRKTFAACKGMLCDRLAISRGSQPLEPLGPQPLVSVIIRTCQQPAMLRRTLESLRWQTYRNFEVVLVEDGEAASGFLAEEFPDLTIRYQATGTRLGRGKAGNLGLSLAKGKYCNFLDQDDYFYADHLEMLVSRLASHPEADIVFGSAMEMDADILSRDPYQLRVERIFHLDNQRIDPFLFCHSCPSPIQTVLFRRSLFEELGGLHEELEGGEDWYFWLKLLTRARRANQRLADVRRATSVFLVPADPEAARRRVEGYQPDYDRIFEDDSLRYTFTAAQLRRFYDDLLGDVAAMEAAGALPALLATRRPHPDTEGEDSCYTP